MFFLVSLRDLSDDIIDCWDLEHGDLAFDIVGFESAQILLINIWRTLPIELVFAIKLVEFRLRMDLFEFYASRWLTPADNRGFSLVNSIFHLNYNLIILNNGRWAYLIIFIAHEKIYTYWSIDPQQKRPWVCQDSSNYHSQQPSSACHSPKSRNLRTTGHPSKLVRTPLRTNPHKCSEQSTDIEWKCSQTSCPIFWPFNEFWTV